jgi:putative selenate reductase
VTLFEREASAGGVCGQIVPRFRLSEALVQHDIDFVAEHGVKFEYGCDPSSPSTNSRPRASNTC